MAFVGDRAKWSVVVALLCGCEFITGALEPVGDSETDTDMAVGEPLSDASGPEPGSGSSDTNATPPLATSTTDDGESADEGGSTSGDGRDPSWGSSGGTSDTWGTSDTGVVPEKYDGSCCEAGVGTTCEDPDIAECVCAIDPWCCEQEWDGICVDLVEEGGCGSCKVGKTNTADPPCCEPHDEPGCEMNDVAVCVCGTDPYCCDVAWDGTCVSEVDLFGCGQCVGAGTTGDIGPFMATDGDTDPTGPSSTGSTGG